MGKNIFILYIGGWVGSGERGIQMAWYLNTESKTGRTNLDKAASIVWTVARKAFVTYGYQCINLFLSLFLSLSVCFYLFSSSYVPSLSLPQTLRGRDPNKVKSKQFHHHKPYYSVYPGVLPCRFI